MKNVFEKGFQVESGNLTKSIERPKSSETIERVQRVIEENRLKIERNNQEMNQVLAEAICVYEILQYLLMSENIDLTLIKRRLFDEEDWIGEFYAKVFDTAVKTVMEICR